MAFRLAAHITLSCSTTGVQLELRNALGMRHGRVQVQPSQSTGADAFVGLTKAASEAGTGTVVPNGVGSAAAFPWDLEQDDPWVALASGTGDIDFDVYLEVS